MKETEISVIVPVYNVERYIKNFLISVTNQIFKDFELIIVNDGSSDKSIEIAEEYLKGVDFDYKIINKENRGQSSARNVGIKEAKGKWLVFPDSDDVLQANYLNNMYFNATKRKDEDIDVVICDINRVNDRNIFEETKIDNKSETKIGKEFFVDFIMHDIEIGPYSLLIKKKVLIDNNIFYNEKSRYSEEFIFITNLLYYSNKVIHTNNKLYNYCLRTGSVSTGAKIEKILNGYSQIKEYSKIYNQNKNKYEIIYNRYALPRWILATARFTCNVLNKYDYLLLMDRLNAKKEIKKLYSFPNLKVKIATVVFETSPTLFYKINKRRIKN